MFIDGALSASVFSDSLQKFIWIFTSGCLGIAVLTGALALAYSHRIFGPKIAFLKHVQALSEGNFEHRVRLRVNDEFHDLAQALKALCKQRPPPGSRLWSAC